MQAWMVCGAIRWDAIKDEAGGSHFDHRATVEATGMVAFAPVFVSRERAEAWQRDNDLGFRIIPCTIEETENVPE